MSSYEEPDGTCHNCGKSLDDDGDHDDHHVLCWKCWREGNGIPDQPWRKPRPEPGTPPASFVEGIADVRDQLHALITVVQVLAERVDRLERRSAAA
jgi:hypothetical protein